MKKLITLLFLALVLTLALCACSANSTPAGSEGEQTAKDTGGSKNSSGEDEPQVPTVKTATGTKIWDGLHYGSFSSRDDALPITIPEFDNMIVDYNSEDHAIYANGEILLGGPGYFWQSFYLSDLTGDSYPELCFTMSWGSGICDIRVVIIDYTTKETIFTLVGRMVNDYYLFLRDGILCVKETEFRKDEPTRTGALTYNGTEISVAWDSEINYTVDKDKESTTEAKEMSMTITESLPSCPAFEYKEQDTPYCFYAFDAERKFYRVLWTNFEGLNENDNVVVEYTDIKELTYDEYPSGNTPRYEMTATKVTRTSSYSTATGTRIWDTYHPDDDTVRYPFFCLPIPEFDNIIVEYNLDDYTVYADGEKLIGGTGHYCRSFYLSDLTGDGYPEFCFVMDWGSGIVIRQIVIIDYTTKETIFSLTEGTSHDVSLFLRDGILCVKETEFMKDEPTRTGALTYNSTKISVAWDSEINYTVDRDEESPAEPASCISKEGDEYILTLPISKKRIRLYDAQEEYVSRITDALVEAAEKKIAEDVAEYGSNSGFYLQINEYRLCLSVEVIVDLDPPQAEGGYQMGGCNIDHKHLFFSEPISC